jgi:excisionase family DNA binding protein
MPRAWRNGRATVGRQKAAETREDPALHRTHGVDAEGSKTRKPKISLQDALARGMKLTRYQAAEYLQVPKRTLDDWAYHGEGPRYARMVGGQTRYDIRDIDAWLESSMSEPTHTVRSSRTGAR